MTVDIEAIKSLARSDQEDLDGAIARGTDGHWQPSKQAHFDRRDLIGEVERLSGGRLRLLGALGYILSHKGFSDTVRGFVVNIIDETPGKADRIEERCTDAMIRIATEIRAAEQRKS